MADTYPCETCGTDTPHSVLSSGGLICGICGTEVDFWKRASRFTLRDEIQAVDALIQKVDEIKARRKA